MRIHVGPLGEPAARGLPRRRLDLDDLGTEPGEKLGAARPRFVLREIENANAVEGLGHGAASPYVVYAEKRTVVARALSSVMTLTTAGLPDCHARSSAGRMSSGLSTNSPWAPTAWAILS